MSSDDGVIYVHHESLQTGAANLRAHKKTFDEVLGQLESDLAPMIGTWSGEAREMYLQKKRLWDKAALDITTLLAHIAQITEDAHSDYSTAVSELAALWD